MRRKCFYFSTHSILFASPVIASKRAEVHDNINFIEWFICTVSVCHILITCKLFAIANIQKLNELFFFFVRVLKVDEICIQKSKVSDFFLNSRPDAHTPTRSSSAYTITHKQFESVHKIHSSCVCVSLFRFCVYTVYIHTLRSFARPRLSLCVCLCEMRITS